MPQKIITPKVKRESPERRIIIDPPSKRRGRNIKPKFFKQVANTCVVNQHPEHEQRKEDKSRTKMTNYIVISIFAFDLNAPQFAVIEKPLPLRQRVIPLREDVKKPVSLAGRAIVGALRVVRHLGLFYGAVLGVGLSNLYGTNSTSPLSGTRKLWPLSSSENPGSIGFI